MKISRQFFSLIAQFLIYFSSPYNFCFFCYLHFLTLCLSFKFELSWFELGRKKYGKWESKEEDDEVYCKQYRFLSSISLPSFTIHYSFSSSFLFISLLWLFPFVILSILSSSLLSLFFLAFDLPWLFGGNV